jgi:hypothetical protein
MTNPPPSTGDGYTQYQPVTSDQSLSEIQLITPATRCPECGQQSDDTGSGYCSFRCFDKAEGNPLTILRPEKPNPNPQTIEEYAASIVTRAENIRRWVRDNRTWADFSPVVLNMIARMEGDMQRMRTLLKENEGKKALMDAFFEDVIIQLKEAD